MIADGHHRYETSLAYRDEQRAVHGPPGATTSVLTYVVELVDDELTVLPIHRLLSGLPERVRPARRPRAVLRAAPRSTTSTPAPWLEWRAGGAWRS